MVDYRENAKWTVYIHIVPKELSGYDNDKYYVGITSQSPKRRWGNGSGYVTNKYFNRTIKKYGWNNIHHEIIAEHLTVDEACDMEKMLIKLLKSNINLYGYNQTEGGDTNIHRSYEGYNNPQAKPIYQFDIDYNFIAQYPSSIEADKATNANSAEAAREKYLSANSYWAREDNVTIDENGKIIMTHKPEITKRKEVFQFDKDFKFIKRYLSTRDVEKYMGIAKSIINYAAKHRTSSHDYYWLYRDDISVSEDGSIVIKDNIKDLILTLSLSNYKENGCIRIVNITNNQLFSSVNEASIHYNVDSSYLCKVAKASLTNKNRTAKKCKWLLYKDYLKINSLTDEEAQKSLFFVS